MPRQLVASGPSDASETTTVDATVTLVSWLPRAQVRSSPPSLREIALLGRALRGSEPRARSEVNGRGRERDTHHLSIT
jgi:hypothetical protein